MIQKDLQNHLQQLHTTPLGAERIKRNLGLDRQDVVAWCRACVKSARQIVLRGKNYYVETDAAIITINAHSFTIITAHPKTQKRLQNFFPA